MHINPMYPYQHHHPPRPQEVGVHEGPAPPPAAPRAVQGGGHRLGKGLEGLAFLGGLKEVCVVCALGLYGRMFMHR